MVQVGEMVTIVVVQELRAEDEDEDEDEEAK